MKIDKVSYQKTYSIGPYLTDRIGIEASVDPGESIEDVLDNLRAKADEWHKSEHPHLYQTTTSAVSQWDANYIPPPSTITTSPPVIDYQIHDASPEGVLKDIQSASLEELKTYKLLASSDKDLYSAYNQRLKELANG